MNNISQVDTNEFYNYVPTDDEQSLYGVVYSNEDAVYVHPELFHTVKQAYEYIKSELERVYDSRMYTTVADAVASVSLRGSFTYRHCVMQNGEEPIVVWRILHMHTNNQMVAEGNHQPIDLYEGAL